MPAYAQRRTGIPLALCPDVSISSHYFADVRETVSLVRSAAQRSRSSHQTHQTTELVDPSLPSITSEKPRTFYIAIIVDGTLLKLASPLRNPLG